MRVRTLLAAPLLLALAGCQSTTIRTGLPAREGPPSRTTVMGYASGLIMPNPMRLARRCPAGVSFLRTEQSLRDFAVQTVTAGVLSPRTVTLICADLAGLELLAERQADPFPPKVDREGRAAEWHSHGGRRHLDRRWEGREEIRVRRYYRDRD